MSRLFPDRFILWLIVTVILAGMLPVRGAPTALLDWATLTAIFFLFFLHGARLPREALISGLADWRLHMAILAATYAVFPLLGLGMAALMPGLLDPMLWTGVIFLCALPSTVQSSIAFTSMARGNVAGAVAAAAGSNLAGVFLTPLLVALMLGAQGAGISAAGVGRIFAIIFLPFLLGHASRKWVLPLIAKRPEVTTAVDKGTILLAVYGAFSAAVVDGLWTRIPAVEIALLTGLLMALLGLVLLTTLAIGRFGNFPHESRAAILFCGSVKSLASGVPMARILFPGAAAGLVILPVMIFHTVQLIVCAWIAAKLGAEAERKLSRSG